MKNIKPSWGESMMGAREGRSYFRLNDAEIQTLPEFCYSNNWTWPDVVHYLHRPFSPPPLEREEREARLKHK